MPPCIPQGYTFPRWVKETPLPCDSDPGQTITNNTPSLKSTFLVSRCVVGNGKRTGKGAALLLGAVPEARSRVPLSTPQRLSDRVMPVSHGRILPRNLPLLQIVEPLPSRNVTAMGSVSQGQQDRPGCPILSSSQASAGQSCGCSSRFVPPSHLLI